MFRFDCILLMLVGGPSQLDTWDMKPARASIDGTIVSREAERMDPLDVVALVHPLRDTSKCRPSAR
jgi:hypothetical protein